MILTLLTDYGHDDEFVGVCHGVIARICPGCQVIDLTHGIPRHEVRRGAVVLRNALPYMPCGVHVAVVDPGVGSERRAVALRCGDGRLLVGPDNGLLGPAWEALGGVAEAVEVSRSPHRLEPLSATFHGRDLFCPVAAQLALGTELGEVGERLDPRELTALELPRARVADGALVAHAMLIDGFGNLSLDAGREQLAQSGLAPGGEVEIEAGGRRHRATLANSFAEVPPGELLIYEDSNRTLAVAVNRGDAASTLGVGPDEELRVWPG